MRKTGVQVMKPNQESGSLFLNINWNKKLHVIFIALLATTGALVIGFYSAIIYASMYVKEEVKRSPGKFCPEIERGFMLSIEAGAIAAGGMLFCILLPRDKSTYHSLDRLFSTTLLVAFVLMAPIPIFMMSQLACFIIWGLFYLGYSTEMTFTNMTIYTAEISPSNIRGGLVSIVSLQIVLGQTLYHLFNLTSSSTKGIFLQKSDFGHFKLGIIPSMIRIFVLLKVWIPDSPRFLYRKGYKKSAVNLLRKLRSPSEVAKEVEAMELSMETEIAEEGCIEDKIDWKRFDIRGKVPYRRLVTGIGCLVAQHFVGMNMVMHYSYTIFHLTTGYSKEEMALVIPFITSVVSLVGTILCTALVDRCGRRRLLLISISGIIISLGMLSFVFYLGKDQNQMWWYITHEEGGTPSGMGLLTLVALALYIIFYSLGLGTVPWIINSEIYSMKYKLVCGILATRAYWISKIIVHYFFLDVLGYYYFYSAADMLLLLYIFSWGVGLFIYLYVPETKGFPLEDVERLLLRQEENNKFKLLPDDVDGQGDLQQTLLPI